MRRTAVVLVALTACSNGSEEKTQPPHGQAPSAQASSSDTKLVVEQLRRSFPHSFGEPGETPRFDRTAAGWRINPTRQADRWASGNPKFSAQLPTAAATPFSVGDDRASISVRMLDLESAPASMENGAVIYAATHRGKSVTYLQRPTNVGTEDFLHFETAPAAASVDYEVTLDLGIAGLRSVDGVVEFVDSAGTPRLRMSRPTIEGSDGNVVDVTVAVNGCAFDTDPRGPWGRAPTSPGATTCQLHLDWSGKQVSYPALLDPAWVLTEDMVRRQRTFHGMSVLADGRVLVSGGFATTEASSELYDPSTRTWAAAGTMAGGRQNQTQTTLPNGKVAIIGGTSSGVPMNRTETYDPATGTWTVGPNMPTPRTQHTATLLDDGRIFVVGGTTGSTVLLSASV